MTNADPRSPALRRQSARDLHRHPRRPLAALRLALVATCFSASAVSAHLGGTSAALDDERAALRVGAHRIEHRALYDVHYLKRDDGEIRQYSDHAGRIFAVAWQTHLPVSLADLLDTPSAAPAAMKPGTQPGPAFAGRHSASLVAGDRVVHVLKMSHLFMGVAQLSTRIPQGVDAKELR